VTLRGERIRVPGCQKLQMTALQLYPYGNSGRQRVNELIVNRLTVQSSAVQTVIERLRLGDYGLRSSSVSVDTVLTETVSLSVVVGDVLSFTD